MAKGGGAPEKTESTVYQSSLPEYARPYYERLMSRAEAETNQPYTAYQGPRIAGFTGEERQAFGQATDYATRGTPEVAAAGARAAAAGETAGGLGGFQADPGSMRGQYDPSVFSTERFSPEDILPFMNPYLQGVTDIERREAERQGGIRSQQIQAGAAGASSFGGYRHGLMESENLRNTDRLLRDIQAKGLFDAYQTAAGISSDAFRDYSARDIQAQQLGEQSRQYGATYGQEADRFRSEQALQAQLESANVRLNAATTQTQAAQAQADIASLNDQIQRSQIGVLEAVGATKRELGQTALDTAYRDFINQRDYERGNIAFMSGVMQGVPVDPQSEITKSLAPPSTASQIGGAGLAGLGLYKALSSGA